MKILFRCRKCGLESEIEDTATKLECPYCNKLTYYKDGCVLTDAKRNVINTWRMIGATYLGMSLLLIIVGIIFWNYTGAIDETSDFIPHPLRMWGLNLFLYSINSLVFSNWWEFLFVGKLDSVSGYYLTRLNSGKKWRIVKAVLLSGFLGIIPLILCEIKLNDFFPALEEAVQKYETDTRLVKVEDKNIEKEDMENGNERITEQVAEED